MAKHTVLCPCGTEFTAAQWQLDSGRGRYCSRRCMYRYRVRPSGLAYQKHKDNPTSYRPGGHPSPATEFGGPGWMPWNRGIATGIVPPNAFPRGELITYGSLHAELRRQRGPASGQVCAMADGTCKGRMHWANISGRYLGIEDFMPLCQSHHYRHDRAAGLWGRSKSAFRGRRRELSEMRALCTGAGGFVAGHLVKALLEQGDRVTAVDIRPLAEWKQVHPAARNYRADISDPAAAAESASGHEVIYHLAADSGGMGYITWHHADCMTNILADVVMARAALHAGARIYYASSSCAYPLHIQADPFTPPVREEDLTAHRFNPELGYGWEKLYAEMCYQAYAADKGLAARIGRYFSVYGPKGWYQGGREKAPTALCRKVATAKLTGQREIEVWGDGTARRTFTYVDDAVAATIAITASDCGDPLNVGSPKACSINELVSVIEDIAGYRVRRVWTDGPVGVGGRPSDDTKIRATVGWKPQVSFRAGMERTYAWVYGQVRAELAL